VGFDVLHRWEGLKGVVVVTVLEGVCDALGILERGLGGLLAFLELDTEAAEVNDDQVNPVVKGFQVIGFSQGLGVDGLEFTGGEGDGLVSIRERALVIGVLTPAPKGV
jgi:hypothetical protein